MTPAAAQAMYARQLDQHGEAMTLTRGVTTQAVLGRVIRAARAGQETTDTMSNVFRS
jgi:hypothetical protein